MTQGQATPESDRRAGLSTIVTETGAGDIFTGNSKEQGHDGLASLLVDRLRLGALHAQGLRGAGVRACLHAPSAVSSSMASGRATERLSCLVDYWAGQLRNASQSSSGRIHGGVAIGLPLDATMIVASLPRHHRSVLFVKESTKAQTLKSTRTGR